MTTVGNIQINREKFPEMFPYDFHFKWSYIMGNFTGMGHDDVANYPGSPAIKIIRTTITESGEKFSYTNINEPSAPSNVLLEAVGNEVMHAE